MTLDEYQKEAIKTAIYREEAKQFYPLFALVEEASEVIEKVASKIEGMGCFTITSNMDDVVRKGKDVAGLAKQIRKANNEYVNNNVDVAFKLLNENMDDETLQGISKELGDVLWQLSAVATGFGLSLGDIAKENIAKLKDRQERKVLEGSGDER